MIRENQDNHGLNRMLSVLELPKSTWYYHEKEKTDFTKKWGHLKPLIREVIDQHPEYGRPRITKELRETYGQAVNHKVVGKLLREWDFALMRAARRTSPSPVEEAIEKAGSDANLVKKRLQANEPIGLFEVLYTDFTTLDYAGGTRSAKLMPIIGHTSKLIAGWELGRRRNKNVACRAWEASKQALNRLDVDWTRTIMHHDQDSVYTSDRWVDQLLGDRLRISFSTNGAKGNTYMESFNGHFKRPIQSMLSESETLSKVREVIEQRVVEWNHDRRHSSLGQMAPMTYIEKHHGDE